MKALSMEEMEMIEGGYNDAVCAVGSGVLLAIGASVSLGTGGAASLIAGVAAGAASNYWYGKCSELF